MYINKNNFDLDKEFILSMLDSNTNSMHSVNEIMEKRVMKAANKISYKVIRDFKKDFLMKFKSYDILI